ncbi:hypothetical protein FRC07_003390 [Ceratobasidium sp. 392]|nr:hypothetical protein FRC07_003390 [Ceratobasidium sp. 392]
MCILSLNYDPLDCTCWAFPPGEYCAYCNAICNAALSNYEAGAGYWVHLGEQASLQLEDKLTEFFEEGRAPTPEPQGSQEYYNPATLVNYLADLGEEAPWQSKPKQGPGPVRFVKPNQKGKRPYEGQPKGCK